MLTAKMPAQSAINQFTCSRTINSIRETMLAMYMPAGTPIAVSRATGALYVGGVTHEKRVKYDSHE